MEGIFSNAQRAEVLTQALPYIKRYTGKVVVVKYGGNNSLSLCSLIDRDHGCRDKHCPDYNYNTNHN